MSLRIFENVSDHRLGLQERIDGRAYHYRLGCSCDKTVSLLRGKVSGELWRGKGVKSSYFLDTLIAHGKFYSAEISGAVRESISRRQKVEVAATSSTLNRGQAVSRV